MVFQHFSLFDTLTVAENVWLGQERGPSLADITRRIEETAGTYGLDIDPHRPVHTLSVGERQRVEIIRALLHKPRLLILDEPTAVLTPAAVQRLFEVLRQLAAEGCSIVYISHKLHEIRALCSACTVLRGGRVTGHCDPRTTSNEELSRLMIGHSPPAAAIAPAQPGPVALSVHDLSLPSLEPFGTSLEAVQLDVHAGEIVGVAGVSGNGQRELLWALSGEDVRAPAHAVAFRGQAIGKASPRMRRRLGLRVIPEERLGRGAVPSMDLSLNLLLTQDGSSWLRPRRLAAQAQALIQRFRIKAPGPGSAAASLSGGNLQKYIVGREIEGAPEVLVVAQPTWGVDVGAAAQIRQTLVSLRDAGCAVLLISEELDELLELSDRIVVMAKGRLSPALTRSQATPEVVGTWMSGLWEVTA
jgi:simple sugar transport system ATP-binding protein